MSDTAVQSPLDVRLRAIMQSWQMPIAADCEQHLSQLIEQAALRVEAEGLTSDPDKLREADTNFRKLLTEMTRQAGALGFKELHEPTFFNSLALLCPIWPFC